MASCSPKWACIAHFPLSTTEMLHKTHLQNIWKALLKTSADTIHSDTWDLRHSFPVFFFFLVTVQGGAISRAVIIRALPGSLKAQLLVQMDASLVQSVFVVG